MAVESVWIFHRGALGDSVMLWPMMRAIRARKSAVTLVSDLGKAKLAEDVLGVRAVSAEHRRFGDLWVEKAWTEPGRILPVGGVSRVISFMSIQGKDRTWTENIHAMFPGAAVDVVDRQLDRRLALELAAKEAGGSRLDEAVLRPMRKDAAILLHLGAGARSKRWSLASWMELIGSLRASASHPSVRVVAGEVEAEQYSRDQHSAFARVGGEFLLGLDELRTAIEASRLVVVADSGPAHLAAQLGVPVIALFGPTLPDLWAPVGPSVRVVAPPTPSAMDWLQVSTVLKEIQAEG